MAKIYQFVARSDGSGARRPRKSQVLAFKPVDKVEPAAVAAPTMDVDAWYHADAIRTAATVRDR